jgi:hypothetical protein
MNGIRLYSRTIIITLILVLFYLQGFAQVMVNATGKPSSLVICGTDGTFSLQIANTSGGTMTGALLTVDLPAGARYTPGSAIGATESNISNLDQPVFTLPDILNSGYSGYDAFLWGTKFLNKTWNFLNFATYLWSSSPYTASKAWAHALNEYDPSVSLYPSSKTNAFSVRCIRD